MFAFVYIVIYTVIYEFTIYIAPTCSSSSRVLTGSPSLNFRCMRKSVTFESICIYQPLYLWWRSTHQHLGSSRFFCEKHGRVVGSPSSFGVNQIMYNRNGVVVVSDVSGDE